MQVDALKAQTRPAALMAALALVAGAASAQYKVVAPDGSVTYTDRPRADGNAKVTTLNRNGSTQPLDTALPSDLRQIAQRYPVTLYTGNDCSPCDNGRRLLQLRGIPFSEKRVSSEEDALGLEKAVGGRTVPALIIGSQPLRGYSETDWTAYLDAAGYPRESKLPRGWQAPPVQAVSERVASAKPTTPAAPAPARAEPAPEPASSGLRF